MGRRCGFVGELPRSVAVTALDCGVCRRLDQQLMLDEAHKG
jgi:hypothetical protein